MNFPKIDPVFLKIGPLQFRWYGLMYVLSFLATYFILKSEARRKKLPLNNEDISDLLFHGALGVVLGGRLGYILFYNLDFYLQNPMKLLAVWEGGMSFHGGFLGVVAAFAPADSLFFLIVGLVLLGIGWNFGLISGTAILVDATTTETRAKTQGSVDVWIALSGASGGMLSGVIAAQSSYLTLSLLGGVVSLILVPLVLWYRRQLA